MRGLGKAHITRRRGQDVVCYSMSRFEGDKVIKFSEMNIPAMRLGPGKHIQGRSLMGGVITPEEFDHFHEVNILVLFHFGRLNTRIYSLLSISSSHVVGLEDTSMDCSRAA